MDTLPAESRITSLNTSRQRNRLIENGAASGRRYERSVASANLCVTNGTASRNGCVANANLSLASAIGHPVFFALIRSLCHNFSPSLLGDDQLGHPLRRLPFLPVGAVSTR